MTNDEKKMYIKQVYGKAVAAGLVSKVREFAAALQVDGSGLSSAMNGNERNLTDSLVRKVRAWAQLNGLEEQAGDARPTATQVMGQRGVFIPEATQAMFDNMAETIRIQAQMLAQYQMTAPFLGGAVVQKNIRPDGK